jgi:hypothetical protein
MYHEFEEGFVNGSLVLRSKRRTDWAGIALLVVAAASMAFFVAAVVWSIN